MFSVFWIKQAMLKVVILYFKPSFLLLGFHFTSYLHVYKSNYLKWYMHLQTNFHRLLLSMFWFYSTGILFQYNSESLGGEYFLLKVECYLLLAHLNMVQS